jgi:hypothetical protein
MKILGLTSDRGHTYTPHLSESGSKGCKRVPIVRAVMGPDWGFTLEDGILTYKALIRPVLGHGAPAFLPVRSQLKHPVIPLQSVQNACLRAVTGFHAATSVQHLHDECRMLQVFDHLSMESSQFLANTRQPSHPSHEVTSRPPWA